MKVDKVGVVINIWSLIVLRLSSTYSTDSFSDIESCSMTYNLFRKINNTKLGISEPNPQWFGNNPNEANNKHWTNKNWLKSRFHFSFAEYSNPKNQGFGVLRVMNDDLVQPNRGFGPHPHRDVEICTYVVSGSLSHKDSMGAEETIGKGSIQFMVFHHSQ